MKIKSIFFISQTKEEKPRKVFNACRGVIKNDSQMALYLLPHIVVHNLLCGNDADHEEVRTFSTSFLPSLNTYGFIICPANFCFQPSKSILEKRGDTMTRPLSEMVQEGENLLSLSIIFLKASMNCVYIV